MTIISAWYLVRFPEAVEEEEEEDEEEEEEDDDEDDDDEEEDEGEEKLGLSDKQAAQARWSCVLFKVHTGHAHIVALIVVTKLSKRAMNERS